MFVDLNFNKISKMLIMLSIGPPKGLRSNPRPSVRIGENMKKN